MTPELTNFAEMPMSSSEQDRFQALERDRETIAKSLAEHPEFMRKLTRILQVHDLMNIAGYSDEEYQPEAGTILPRLTEAKHAGDVQNILFEEFRTWFGEDESKRHSDEYKGASRAIWNAWVAYEAGIPL